MCLAIPGVVRRVSVGDDGLRTAEVEYPGQSRSVSLLYLPEAAVGDSVLVQAGFAIRRLTPEQAAEVRDALASGLSEGGLGPAPALGGTPR